VYDGSALIQEHTVGAEVVSEEWVYSYSDLTRDYLRHPAGVRQRERSGGQDTDHYLQANTGALEYKVERDPIAVTAYRTERSSFLDQVSGGSFTSGLSNLATSGDYIEMYGDSTNGFDALIQIGGRHYLGGVARCCSRMGNNSYIPHPEPIPRAPMPYDGLPGDFPPDDPYTPPPGTPSIGVGWRAPGSLGVIYGGAPKLPNPASCCAWSDCMWDKWRQGWFEFCCNNDCREYWTGGNILADPCPPQCSDCESEVGHDCRYALCVWSFGCGGYCGVEHLHIGRSCKNFTYRDANGTPLYTKDLTDTIKEAFRAICRKAPQCACHTYFNDAWKNRLFHGLWILSGRSWMSVWGCIADICRSGNLAIECYERNQDECKGGTLGWVERNNIVHSPIHLCPNIFSTGNWPNTIFHEMLHKCGIAVGWLEFKWSASYYIADRCMPVDPSTYIIQEYIPFKY